MASMSSSTSVGDDGDGGSGGSGGVGDSVITSNNMNENDTVMKIEEDTSSTNTNTNSTNTNTITDNNTNNNSSQSEREHLEQVCDSFRQYATFARCARQGQRARLMNLPLEQRLCLPRSLIDGTPEARAREDAMREAELCNQYFFDRMLRHAGLPHSQDVVSGTTAAAGSTGSDVVWSSNDMIDKAHSVLKSLARDWSKDGAAERSMTYAPLLDGLKRHVPTTTTTTTTNTNFPRVLVPGAGVGRLALEIYALGGYEVQGNEFSLHMLLASDFVLNGTSPQQHSYSIAPWFHTERNVCRADDPARQIKVPDIDPGHSMRSVDNNDDNAGNASNADTTTTTTSTPLPDFSMAAGEFVSIYNQPAEKSKWNAVVTCFFLDTAPSLVEYLTTLHHLLAPDGLLLNFGPLHYHWTGPPHRPDDGGGSSGLESYRQKHRVDARYLESVSLTWEDVREVLWRVGFVVLEEQLGIKARYTADARSFMNSDYRCIYFVAKKGTPRPRVEDSGSTGGTGSTGSTGGGGANNG